MNATRKQLLVSGIIQLVIGSLCFIFGIAGLVSAGWRNWFIIVTTLAYLTISMGLWIVTTGVLGILTNTVKNSQKRITTNLYLVFTIMSIVFAGIMTIYFSVALVGIDKNNRRNNYSMSLYGDPRYNWKNSSYVMIFLLLVLSILEFGIGIWASLSCCAGMNCCCGRYSQTAAAATDQDLQTTRKQLLASGIIQVVIGSLVLIFGIAGKAKLVSEKHLTIISIDFFAIWMGLWFGITGLLGILTKVKKSFKPMTVLYWGFSITSIFFAIFMMIYVGVTEKRDLEIIHFVIYFNILVLGFLEFSMGIWASVCCGYLVNKEQSSQRAAAATDQDLQRREAETEDRGHSFQTMSSMPRECQTPPVRLASIHTNTLKEPSRQDVTSNLPLPHKQTEVNKSRNLKSWV